MPRPVFMAAATVGVFIATAPASAQTWLTRPVTLKEIKGDPFFSDFALVRISRLSVMPVTGAQWKKIEALGARAS